MRYKKMWNDLVYKLNQKKEALNCMVNYSGEVNDLIGRALFDNSVRMIENVLKIMRTLESEEIENDSVRKN